MTVTVNGTDVARQVGAELKRRLKESLEISVSFSIDKKEARASVLAPLYAKADYSDYETRFFVHKSPQCLHALATGILDDLLSEITKRNESGIEAAWLNQSTPPEPQPEPDPLPPPNPHPFDPDNPKRGGN